ncbi:hypothetical protein [Kitasatospora sp. LaBMicrA B282]|uniref:hypothetical protein n=1 Tax=Kitasatospora sp. LaBMicrA B282 TaxID=3420949 RepID=UPI003D12DAFA
MVDEDPEWPEDEYLRCLRGERARYAWVLCTYGGMTSAQADAEAAAFYPYELPGAPHRGLVFHDEAWHWAMLGLRGDYYWGDHPDLAQPPAAYRALGEPD